MAPVCILWASPQDTASWDDQAEMSIDFSLKTSCGQKSPLSQGHRAGWESFTAGREAESSLIMDLTWDLPPFSFTEPMAATKADTQRTWWELEIWKRVRNVREKWILKETRGCSGREGGRQRLTRLSLPCCRRGAEEAACVLFQEVCQAYGCCWWGVSANKHILCNAKEMFHHKPVEECYSGSAGECNGEAASWPSWRDPAVEAPRPQGPGRWFSVQNIA